jgi:transposase
MDIIARKCFPNTVRVIDRFHVQKLASEALQEIRIRPRWDAIEAENNLIDEARKIKRTYVPEILQIGETIKQMLARSDIYSINPNIVGPMNKNES